MEKEKLTKEEKETMLHEKFMREFSMILIKLIT